LPVIGAGPTGLELARLAAHKGHKVTFYESNLMAGGQLHWWASLASTRELAGIDDWRISELERLKVNIIYNQTMTESDIQSIDADVCFIATGAIDHRDAELAKIDVRVMTPTEVLQQP
jgi:NADPH-dependent 2,4-dienoyl-CoA reductase/sulfur reductase-like enzyme